MGARLGADYIERALRAASSPTEIAIPAIRPRDNSLVHSSSANRCGRQIAYKLRFPLERSTTSLAADLGTVTHQFLQARVKRWFPDTLIETPVSWLPKYPVIGSADIVCDDGVIDIKTHASYRTPNGDSAHVLQVVLYALRLGKPKAMVLYVDRGALTQSMTIIDVLGEAESAYAELDRMKGIYDNFLDEMPKPTAMMEGSRECSYCDFREVCLREKSLGR